MSDLVYRESLKCNNQVKYIMIIETLHQIDSMFYSLNVEINYVCADFIGDSITKITSNKGRGFQFYFRNYVVQPCSEIGTAYISFSIKYSTKCAETHFRRLRRCLFYNIL